ncbi:MAG TPA: ABC transporter substrate-binding protein [Methylomirabilota bacterium]|nr:ABC transporter substrate-binding protein [Methylomirabilota bacterium]
MLVIRRRLIFWLIKAYIKKSGKIIILSFLLGLIIFFSFIYGSRYFARIVPVYKKESIGVIGAYRQDELPSLITNKFSRGLTTIETNGTIKPDLAQSWEIKNNGKTYIFHLKQHEYFSDGVNVTSNTISYNFSDVTTNRPDKYTIVYNLKDAYTPFLVTVSRGVFEKGFIGVGNYRIEDIKLNGSFVQSLTIVSVKNKFDTIRFQFYPSQEALKLAFLLGEISKATGLTTPTYKNVDFKKNANTRVNKVTNYAHLVTLFYNTTDSELSDKKVRIALSYALPDGYTYGQKAYMPYSPESYYYNIDVTQKKQDYEHAKLLLSSSPHLTIKTLRNYRKTADAIAATWKNIGIQTTIEEVDGMPDHFQVFLGDFSIPKDPDQYTLWHSGQINNITKYKNLRIDKLLEDGRKTADSEKRKAIYMDFQKYLMEDVPASFLYFPYEYDFVRK